jgi:hypothetical protein
MKLKRIAKVLNVPLELLLTGRLERKPKLRLVQGGKGRGVDKPQRPE